MLFFVFSFSFCRFLFSSVFFAFPLSQILPRIMKNLHLHNLPDSTPPTFLQVSSQIQNFPLKAYSSHFLSSSKNHGFHKILSSYRVKMKLKTYHKKILTRIKQGTFPQDLLRVDLKPITFCLDIRLFL